MNLGRKAALAVVVTGAATLCALALMRIMAGPDMPPHEMPNTLGMRSSMIWLELAKNADEVFLDLGPPDSDDGAARRAVLDAMNRYDFVFMTCYSLFNAALIVFMTHLNTYRFKGLIKLRAFLTLGLLLAAAMFVGDVIENLQLLKLTHYPTVEAVPERVIEQLNYWTRVKWAAIFTVCLMMSAGYTAYFRRIPTLLIPLGYAIAGVSGIVAISMSEARWLLEVIAMPHTTVVWTASLVHAGLFFRRNAPRTAALPAHTPPSP